ncbi:MAG: DUF4230 domain-containing protein [Chitinophagaceae bacterium]|nr:DUF4230 domain-containing protein [Chitinophagaceae bacterium]
MRSPLLVIVLLIALCTAMYFLGKKSGTTEVKASIINNTQLVRQIAELSSLEITGTTTAKITNVAGETGIWNNLKNYFAENTLQVSIPYIAKYGVDVSKAAVSINKTDTALVIKLPACKMLSLQLVLDKMETMNQTGVFASTTIADMKIAEQQLYSSAQRDLSSNSVLLEKAKRHISEIYNDYYKPLGYKVVCTFTQ